MFPVKVVATRYSPSSSAGPTSLTPNTVRMNADRNRFPHSSDVSGDCPGLFSVDA
jgi:hypothetical protein